MSDLYRIILPHQAIITTRITYIKMLALNNLRVYKYKTKTIMACFTSRTFHNQNLETTLNQSSFHFEILT